ncbi:hypothetical protein BH10CYA1_BH10CYA1_35000 [soil metagenome]
MPPEIQRPLLPATIPAEHASSGPSSIGDAWVHSINPVALFRDANESSKNWLPFGIGFHIDHPSALASPEILELAVLDPIFRVSKAAVDLVSIPIYSLQDGGSAVKDGINVGKDITFLGIDLITLKPSEAYQDMKNIFKDSYSMLKNAGRAIVVNPVVGVYDAIMHIL